jgi:ABC-2 type transport system permease protein
VALIFSTGANIAGSASMESDSADYDIVTAFAQSALNMTMMGCIFSMILGGLVVSREEDGKTIEFLLSHPVHRTEIALSKLSAFLLLVVILNAVLLIADIVFLEVFKSEAGYDLGAALGIWLSEFTLIFFLGAAGIFCSAFVTKGGAVVGTCIAVPIAATVLAALGSVDNTILRLLSYLSPFRYFRPQTILTRGGAEPVFVIVFVALGSILIAVFFSLYRRREFAV